MYDALGYWRKLIFELIFGIEGKVTENGAEENTNHTHNGWKEPTGK